MYVLVNTETTDVDKYATLDDLLMDCMKKNGVLNSFSTVAKAAVSEVGKDTEVPTNKPTPEAKTISVENVSSKKNLKENPLVMLRPVINQEVAPLEPPQYEKLIEEARVDKNISYTHPMTLLEEGEEENIDEDRDYNKMEVLERFSALQKQLHVKKTSLTHKEQCDLFTNLYTNEFVNRFCDGTTTDLTKTNFAMCAWKLLLEHPTLFGVDTQKYKAFFDSDIRWFLEKRGLDETNFSILYPNSCEFKNFYTLATSLRQFANIGIRFSYGCLEKLAYLSYKAILTNTVSVALVKKWISAFMSKLTRSSETESIKSSTLYESFLDSLKFLKTAELQNDGLKLFNLLTANITQKMFSKILKDLGWKSQRKSDGIHWISVKFGSTATLPSDYTDPVKELDDERESIKRFCVENNLGYYNPT